MKKIHFRGEIYNFIITDHAKVRMKMRGIDKLTLQEIIETGMIKPKTHKNKFWVFKNKKERKNNFICTFLSVESSNLIVITTLINRKPKE